MGEDTLPASLTAKIGESVELVRSIQKILNPIGAEKDCAVASGCKPNPSCQIDFLTERVAYMNDELVNIINQLNRL